MLKFIALSGTTGVTENLYVYEYGADMVVVDCGVGFPDPDMYGVDLVIPDFTYILENKDKLRGVLISHGHEDHLGALPFLLKEVNANIYATKLVAGFIEEKLDDYKIKSGKVNVFDPEKDSLKLGVFNVTPFRVSHSVPDGVGFAIDTPEGKFIHVPDYKFDWTPVDQRPFDVSKLSMLASGGVLCLASDCLGATTPGYTESERQIEERIYHNAEGARGAIFFTTISSNISRIQQALNVAKSLGRKVVFVGHSIDSKAEIAKRLGYLHYEEDLVLSRKSVAKTPKEKLMYIISGSYGQPGSALYRAALGEHEYISINESDVVIFSSDPAPPGSKDNVDFVVDKLIEVGAEVHYYDIQDDLHVSGHGSRQDLSMLIALTRPKYLVPIGGTTRHMRAYKKLASEMGCFPENVFELKPGDMVNFQGQAAKKDGHIGVRDVLVDGLGIGDVGNVVLRDRKVLSRDGVVIVTIQREKETGKLLQDPELISRGFVFQGAQQEFLAHAAKELANVVNNKAKEGEHALKYSIVDFMERYFNDKLGRRPMILPVIVEV